MAKLTMRRATLPFVGSLAVACAVSTEQRGMPAATRSWLARFDEALRFIPPGMKSHWFADRSICRRRCESA